MGANENGIKMVKLSKEERKQEKIEEKKAASQKRKTVFETEKDKVVKKRYYKLILATALILLFSILVLVGMVVRFVNNQFGVCLLLILCATSTYITRKFK